jgi:hypothetical protein
VARRVLALTLLGLALVVCVALAASESLTNRTGQTATAVTVTFSEQVLIASYDESIFPTKIPSSRAETFRFSGGQLESGAQFAVSWTPSGAEITGTEWETIRVDAAEGPPRESRTPFARGITFGAMYWPASNVPLVGYNLGLLRAIGVDSITLVVDWYVDNYRDPSIEPWFRDKPGFPDTTWYFPTLPDEDVRMIIESAHAMGMTVMLKPHVETLDWALGGIGRYGLNPGPDHWDELFSSYTAYLLHYASIAEETGVEIFCMGCELESMTIPGQGPPDSDRRWREMIARVRDVYHGTLTYSAAITGTVNGAWCSPCQITFWDALDYIGFEIYRGLTDKRDPTVEELEAGVRDIFDKYAKPLSEQYGKPIIVPEVNYYSFDGMNQDPIGDPSGRPADLQEQADCYDAVLNVTEDIARDQGYLVGLYWWAGFLVAPADAFADDAWVADDTGDWIWSKPAEDVLRRHWGTPTDGSPTGTLCPGLTIGAASGQRVVVDGFSHGALTWTREHASWFSGDGSRACAVVPLEPTQVGSELLIRYSLPADCAPRCALRFEIPFDASAYTGIEVTIRGSPSTRVLLGVASQDHGLHLQANQDDWKASRAPCYLELDSEERTFRVPFLLFFDDPLGDRYPDVTPGVNDAAIWEVQFWPDSNDCDLQILSVAFYK